ncbi:Tyrosinase [Rhizoctonia solani AG-1 IB]|uniref:Tyrosinase n=1 Tax=Thanatephorus cucumeris (strain AG1-IB / isolate 7/3/14) TaxID=1108050 RepID=M5C859_THACB|nr:Tyrosinase [Rhizoctonia solani AG-1 IB]
MEVSEFQNLPDPDNPPKEMAYFREWKRTWRRPNSSPVNVQENYAALDADLKNKSKTQRGEWEKGSWAQLTNDVANMFSFPVDLPPELYANAWDEFSNTTFQSGRKDSKNHSVFHSPFVQHATPIEQPHNRVHLIVGGLGHMGDNDTAGFDPIFYLHHCNVDRLISFWEQIFPYYVPGTDGYLDVDGETRVPFSQAGGTYIETPSQTVDSETPLMPFRKSDNTYWTLKDTHLLRLTKENNDPRIVQNKYYTYNPIAGVELATDDKVLPVKDREIQRGILQRHFGYNPVKVVKKNPKISFSAFSVESPSSYDTQEEVDLPAGASELEDFRQFLVEVSLSPQYHNSSYTLNLTVGTDNNHLDIGAVSVLGRGQSAGCGNCQAKRAANARVRGVIQIPYEAIVGILQARYTEPPSSEVEVTADDTSALSTEKLVRDLRLSIGSYVDLPSGKLHSELSKKVGMSESGNKGNDAAPSIRLLSCRVHKIDVGDKGEPSFGFHDWQNHGSVIGTWEKSASGGE